MKYLKLTIKNLQPLSISDVSTSYSGQSSCFRYIPGSTIRGYVINKIAMDNGIFIKHKKDLFSTKVCFLNGYPVDNGDELFPSFKGFYEDKKALGPVQNVVINGEFDEGMKRASVGRFCTIKEEAIRYYNIETSSNLKIQIANEEQKVFRSEYLLPGYVFVSYVAIDQDICDELIELIEDSFKRDDVFFGNERSQGFGKCKVTVEKGNAPASVECTQSTDTKDHIYMALLSNTVMRGSNGEYCGINLRELEEKMGVSNLEIEHCATTAVDIHGYNSTWHSRIPTVPMYEQGSVFKLCFTGTFTKEKIREVTDKGLGERLNEGFGRVAFLGDKYEAVRSKVKGALLPEKEYIAGVRSEEDEKVIELIAKKYYRTLLMNAMQEQIPLNKGSMKLNKSQVGTVLSILEKNRYNEKVADTIRVYFAHAEEKQDNQKVQKKTINIKGFSKSVTDILNASDSIQKILGVEKQEIMGISTDKLLTEMERKQLAVTYVIELIKYARKED